MAAKLTLDDIKAAHALIAEDIVRTPTINSPSLSAMTGAEIVLKLENLQRTGSFKVRGAGVKMRKLDAETAKRGVVAASAGNHAQGVAYHAREMGIPALIYMPERTPFNKRARTESYGATVILEGEDFKACNAAARARAEADGCAFIPPYDDLDVIAGQGTVALEMLEDGPDLDCLIVPVGGGGLIAGIASAAKAMKPDIEIVGAEAELFPCLYETLKGLPMTGGGQTVAEGIAVKTPGALPLEIVRDLISDVLLADEEAIEKAIHLFLEHPRIVAEGAGAAGLAALMGASDRFRGRRVGLIVSGGNIDSRLLASILMRGLARDGRIARLRIQIPDVPGALAIISKIISDNDVNIVEVHHQRLFYDTPVKQTHIDVVVETQDRVHVGALVRVLDGEGFPTRILGGEEKGKYGLG
jgi:threonine dehydratase